MTSFAEREISSIPPEQLIVRSPARAAPGRSVLELCREALDSPIDSPRVAELGAAAGSIVIVISDRTRDEPRPEMVAALLEVLPRDRVRIVVASGTHDGDASVVPPGLDDLDVIVHRAEARGACVDLGTTAEGTPVRILREVAEADLTVITGRIRPHYFAGYSGGVKGLFPGCGYKPDVLQNHELKADETSRLGRVVGNRCRDDMEDAAGRVPAKVAIVDVLADCDGQPVAAVSGHPVAAHRFLCGQARTLFGVRAPRSPVVVVADRPPVSRSLYQASKLIPPAGALLEPGGVVVVVAECVEGIEPIERVNEGIYRIGVARQLPRDHTVLLVSELPEIVVSRSYAEPAPSLAAALEAARRRTGATGPIPVVWRAGEAITEAEAPGQETARGDEGGAGHGP